MPDGFWGGINQHSHANAGTGGLLTQYRRRLGYSRSGVNFSNSTVDTVLEALTLPEISNGQVLQIHGCLWVFNNTGVAQATPNVWLRKGGAGAILLSVASAAGLITNGQIAVFHLTATVLNLFGAFVQIDAQYRASFQSTALAAPLINSVAQIDSLAYDMSASFTLELRGQLLVANANLSLNAAGMWIDLIG